jgi:RHS repeat-associated protein
MPGRQFNGNGYRYGFNGKENDNETVGTGEGTQDYGLRIYNPALGKFLSVDPLFRSYPWNSTYAFAENDVIRSTDLDGGEKNIQIQYQANKNSAIVFKTVAWKDCYPNQEHGPMGTGTYVLRKEGNVITRQYYPSLVDGLNKILGKKLDDETARKNSSGTHSGKGTGSTVDAVPEVKIYDPHAGGTNPNYSPDGGKVTYNNDAAPGGYDGTPALAPAPDGIDVYDGENRVSIAKKNGDTADVYRHGKAQIPDGLPMGQHNTVKGTENWKEGVREANEGKKVIDK